MHLRVVIGICACALAVSAQNPNTARWPAFNAGDPDLFVVTNRAQTSLTAPIDNVTTTFPVANISLFTPPVIVTIETEVMHCAVAGGVLLQGCVRAQEGTVAAAHPSGALVFGYFSAWHYNQVAAEIKAIEANATKLPAFNNLGTLSGTPTFPVTAQIQTFKITLNGAVTSSTLGTPISNGLVYFDVCQNGTGGFTFAWPAGFSLAQIVSPSPNTCSVQGFQWDGAAAIPLSPGTATGSTFPDVKYMPAADCVNGMAGSGWSTGLTPAALCRAGTNNKEALLSPWGASDTAQLSMHLSKDWNSTINPSVSLDVTSTDATNGHTIIMQLATACDKGDGSTTDDVAFNSPQSFSTITLNGNANRTWTATLNNITMTGCAAPGVLRLQLSRTADTATNVGVIGLAITVPRTLMLQAN